MEDQTATPKGGDVKCAQEVRDLVNSAASVENLSIGAVFNIIEPDDCCTRPLAKALRNATAPMERWECPKCGQEWKPEQKGLARHWMPQPWAVRL